jgi:hypothetical protein
VNAARGGNGGDGLNYAGLGTFYAGGGGGWGYTSGGGGGIGGAGGGGNGSGYPSVPGVAGTINTGGGGGGTTATTCAGGSGVVIIRYPDEFSPAITTAGNPTYTVTGGYRIYKFTASGSITF